MSLTVIEAARVLTPLHEIRDAAVVVEDGVIREVGARSSLRVPSQARVVKLHNATIVPGFLDVHIHGAGGHDVMEATADAMQTVARTVARHGCTSLVATTVTAGTDKTCASLEGMAMFIRQQSAARGLQSHDAAQAEFLGIHFEGPFISQARRGVHPPQHIAEPSPALLQRFLDAAGDTARILTLAPERPGATELIQLARARGLRVAMGHTDATYAEARNAITHGASHAVHVFNAMRPFSHRETGVLGAVLTENSLSAELIADNVHVDAPAMRILLAAKGVARVILVSDATAAAAMPDGQYKLGEIDVTLSGGVCRDTAGHLAGSALTLDRALRNIVELGIPLADAVRMATLNPAQLLGIEKKKGVIAPGADADLVVLDDALRVQGVMARGMGLG